MAEKLFTKREGAEYLGIGYDSFRKLLYNGRIPSQTVDGMTMAKQSDIDSYRDNRKRNRKGTARKQQERHDVYIIWRRGNISQQLAPRAVEVVFNIWKEDAEQYFRDNYSENTHFMDFEKLNLSGTTFGHDIVRTDFKYGEKEDAH